MQVLIASFSRESQEMTKFGEFGLYTPGRAFRGGGGVPLYKPLWVTQKIRAQEKCNGSTADFRESRLTGGLKLCEYSILF
jgi:hypothetical protein